MRLRQQARPLEPSCSVPAAAAAAWDAWREWHTDATLFASSRRHHGRAFHRAASQAGKGAAAARSARVCDDGGSLVPIPQHRILPQAAPEAHAPPCRSKVPT